MPPSLEMLVGGEEVVDVLLWHVPQVLECPVGEAEVQFNRQF